MLDDGIELDCPWCAGFFSNRSLNAGAISHMTEPTDTTPPLTDFLTQLESIPWFSNIGKPVDAASSVERIYDWNEWPGPNEASIIELSWRQQDLFDALMESAGSERARFSALWESIHGIVFRVAAPKVPYDPQQDAWHAPTMAVWQAAWTAGLVGLCYCAGRPVPEDLAEQWKWFVIGHWPSGYAAIGAERQLGPLLVY